MKENNCCISIYSTPQAVTQALEALHAQGCDMRQISVIGKGCHDKAHITGFYRLSEQVRYCGAQGSFWEELWAELPGEAFFWVPGFGAVAAAGRIVNSMIKGLEGIEIGGGFSVPGAALYGMGVPRPSINEYEQAINAEKILLIVEGQRSDVERACGRLHSETQQVIMHSA